MASITPSGRALSKLITAEIAAETGTVIELGPRTRVFTAALLDQGVPEANLVLIEYGSEFAAQLGLRLLKAKTFQMGATSLRKPGFIINPAGAGVSGLPLLSMPARNVIAVLEGAFGKMALFTNSPTVYAALFLDLSSTV